MNKVFTSKRDNYTLVRTAVCFTIAIIFSCFMLAQSHENKSAGIVFVVLFMSLFMTGLLFSLKTTYNITPEGLLIINAGLRKIRIHISDIHSAVIQHSYGQFITWPFASSVYQVKLSYKKYSEIVISPVNQREFIHSLQLQNPGITAETGTFAV